MNKEEREEIKELINLLYNNHISQYGKRKLENYIKELQKEIEELKFKLLARERGEAEFEVLVDTLKKENEKLEKTIDLIIDDFQTEGYFKEMTYEQVKKYYDNRNELNQEINILPLNLDLTSE